MVHLLLEFGADVDIFMAAALGDTAILRRHADKGVS